MLLLFVLLWVVFFLASVMQTQGCTENEAAKEIEDV